MNRNEASPRPWRVDDSTAHERFGRKFVRIRDANGQSITVEGKGRLFAEDAALIVDAVNRCERLRHVVRILSECFTPGQKSVLRLVLAEDRAAIGEDKP